jgi:2-keto-3-deoxygluconate permease
LASGWVTSTPNYGNFYPRGADADPLLCLCAGNTIDLSVIAQTGLLGILLGLAVIVITGIPLIIADKVLGGGDGTAGLAASSSAGAAVATPVLIAEMVPEFKAMAPAATALVATSVIVTSILVPILTLSGHEK